MLLLCLLFSAAGANSVKSKLLSVFKGIGNGIYADPESLISLNRVNRFYGPFQESYWVAPSSASKYPVLLGGINDLTIKSEVEKPIWQLSGRELFGEKLFQTPVMSGIYERGYRQNFENFGFPGIEKEFEEANELFKSVNASVILDLSCGSGFMTRNFIKSGAYSRVISGDLSLSMLRETRLRCKREGLSPELIRCDSARLPIRNETLDAVHAGAAMHCWPRVNQAAREIYRVLKPGGVFFATTIFSSALTLGINPKNQYNGGFNLFKDENELFEIVSGAGFERVEVRKEGRACAIIKAYKSSTQELQ